MKNITKYVSDSVTYVAVICGNWLSSQNDVQKINELTNYSITLKTCVFIFIIV